MDLKVLYWNFENATPSSRMLECHSPKIVNHRRINKSIGTSFG